MNKKNNDLKMLKLNAGFLIILVAVVSLCITILSGGIWFLSIDYSQIFNTKTISGNSMNAQVKLIDHDELFDNHYYSSLELLSNTIAYGTTWLDLCAESQTFIGEKVYMQVCSDIYSSIKSIKTALSKYISNDLISFYMADYYKEYNNGLYVVPFNITKDDTYAGLKSYVVKSKTSSKIEYIVTSKYSDVDCGDSCKYTYKNHKFVLEKQNNNWVVTGIEMPY